MFLAQQSGQLGVFFVLSVAGATALGRCVACRTFQSYRIEFKRKPFLLRGSVEKCATKNVKIEIAKNSSLDSVEFWPPWVRGETAKNSIF